MSGSLKQDYRRYFWPPFTQVAALSGEEPMIIVSGKGANVVDETGKEYIDVHGGLWVSNVGHGRQEVIDAITRQASELAWFPSFYCMSNNVAVKLAKRLVEMTAPEGMSKAFFASGGSEGVETALKMVRQYWRLKGYAGKYKVIARRRAYHGVTMGALSATGTDHKHYYEPLVPGFRHIEAPYCYRCPYGLAYPACELNCAQELERTIIAENPSTVAAFIGEPVMGAGGLLFPPDGYWQAIEDICRRHDVLLIADEVMTGFGRTGKMFAMRHWGVKPDIMVFAKALTSGYQPLAATLVNSDIPAACLGEDLNAGRLFLHGNTYAGHPVACAAALANLDITEREDLPGRSAKLGAHLLNRLKELEELPKVGHVDGRGLLARVELVDCKTTKRRFDQKELVGWNVAREMQKMGVILRPLEDTLTFSPPLIIAQEQLDAVVDKLREVLIARWGRG